MKLIDWGLLICVRTISIQQLYSYKLLVLNPRGQWFKYAYPSSTTLLNRIDFFETRSGTVSRNKDSTYRLFNVEMNDNSKANGNKKKKTICK